MRLKRFHNDGTKNHPTIMVLKCFKRFLNDDGTKNVSQ